MKVLIACEESQRYAQNFGGLDTKHTAVIFRNAPEVIRSGML
jgi:hypothetical protein